MVQIPNTIGLKQSELEVLLGFLSGLEGLKKVVVFGSRGRGDFKEFSDIDLCLFADKNLHASSIKEELNQLRIPYLFDCVQREELSNDKLKGRIERDGKVLWEVGK
jgi:uncharacterized protein